MSGIQVHVRVRPHADTVWATADTVIYSTAKQDTRYMFNRVHGVSTTNATLFHEIEPCVHSAFDGKNVTVMAYGQTGSGKTHSMTGTHDDLGIIGRVAKLLVDLKNSRPGTTISASYVEIYNESVRDLMDSGKREANLRDGPDNTIIFDRSSTSIGTFEEFCALAQRAENARQYGVTDMNEHSSRSHIILTFEINKGGQKSSISLVDLAGSESASRANTDGQLLREGGFINRSLLALGNVVDAIVDNRTHIPYRESKLTRILRNCLGGNGLTFIVCCLNPTKENFDQTVASLRFAQRAMRIRNDPTVAVSAMPTIIHQHLDWIEHKRNELNFNLAEQYSAGVQEAYKASRGTIGSIMQHRGEQLDDSQRLIERMGKIYMLRERRIAFQTIAKIREEVASAKTQCEHNQLLAEGQQKRCRVIEEDYIAEKEKRKRMEPLMVEKKKMCQQTKQDSALRLRNAFASQVTDVHICESDERSGRELIEREQLLELQDAMHWFTTRLSTEVSTNIPLWELEKEYEREKALHEDMESAYEMVREDGETIKSEQPLDIGGDTAIVETEIVALKEEEQVLRERQRHQAREALGAGRITTSATPQQRKRYGASYESPYAQRNLAPRNTTPKPTRATPPPRSKQALGSVTENVSKLNNAKELLRGVRERMTSTAAARTQKR